MIHTIVNSKLGRTEICIKSLILLFVHRAYCSRETFLYLCNIMSGRGLVLPPLVYATFYVSLLFFFDPYSNKIPNFPFSCIVVLLFSAKFEGEDGSYISSYRYTISAISCLLEQLLALGRHRTACKYVNINVKVFVCYCTSHIVPHLSIVTFSLTWPDHFFFLLCWVGEKMGLVTPP